MSHAINWDDPSERFRLAERLGPAAYNAAIQEHLRTSCVETVAGHGIRPVGTRFGRLFAVGKTDQAFGTIEQARAFAIANPAA